MNPTYVFKSTGFYLGFIDGGNLFSRDGDYLGWIEDNFAWDSSGQYKGQLRTVSGNNYILKNVYAVSPVPKVAKAVPTTPAIPAPPANIPAINLGVSLKDGF